MKERKNKAIPLLPFAFVKPLMTTGIKKSHYFPDAIYPRYATGHGDKMLTKRRTFICTLPENECVFLNAEEFCRVYPQYCPRLDPKKAFTGMAYLNDFMDWEYKWEYTYEECHNETMIDYCQIKLVQQNIPCKKSYKRIPVVDSKGYPNCCYTIESLVGQPNAEEDLYPNTFVIDFVINTQAEEYVMSSVPVMIQVKVHDRRAMVNPFSDGYSLEGGMEYNAYVSMVRVV
ncbi:hypothetical protein AVEN_60657-1 [Araneus ventricosus]|uniref:Uncharacterized protein n=1 Tax=Araneus ventricosus TaxID=182803 RepID=A0A4Y2H0U4_ARAVE|nr:hypothetical protein AVEN_60657-1 [Araneus ventricosus]